MCMGEYPLFHSFPECQPAVCPGQEGGNAILMMGRTRGGTGLGVGDESSRGHGESEVPVGHPRGCVQVVACEGLEPGEEVGVGFMVSDPLPDPSTPAHCFQLLCPSPALTVARQPESEQIRAHGTDL